MQNNMNDRKEKLLSFARTTKDALYAEWNKDGKEYFDDHNNFTGKKGLMSEAIGLTSVLLMYIRFVENKEVFESGKNDFETTKIITTSFNYVYDQIKNSGYTATPFVGVEESDELFDMDCSYVDTLTWVLSLSSLIVYADRQKLISLDQSLIEKAKELLGDSLTRIIDGQLDCGAWGFSTDKGCKPSLYSTYAVATSLADFFDYIMGELEYYSSEENQAKNAEEFYDKDVIKDIKPVYERNHPNRNLVDDIIEVRSKLQIWLLKNCLPLLPKLASCVPMTAQERELMGYPEQKNNVIIDEKDYLNLYYAYYIIDILITTSSDKRYKDIVRGEDEAVSLKNLSDAYKGVISDTDRAYFFLDKKNKEKALPFYDEYTNLAIQSSRASFSNAMRTGGDFWDSKSSELDIIWEHNDISPTIIGAIRGKAKIKEPTLIPMALRANAVFCYYIIERTDVTVDNLFDIICDNRSVESKTVTEDNETNTQIANLWDNISYSLIVTERSIEAMVDYYDYLEKTVQETEKAILSDETLSLDEVINKKIAAFLKSEDGGKLLAELGYVQGSAEKNASSAVVEDIDSIIEKKITEMMGASVAKEVEVRMSKYDRLLDVSGVDMDQQLESLERIFGFMESEVKNNLNGIKTGEGATAPAKLAASFIDLLEQIMEANIYRCLKDKNIAENDMPAIIKNISDQFEELIGEMGLHYKAPKGSIVKLYNNYANQGV